MNNSNDLDGYIDTQHSVECQSRSCSESDATGYCDETEAEVYFWNKGWRVTAYGNLYCPKCAKKKLKQ